MNRRRAIQKTLGRVGMQASYRDVVASLAGFGIDVTQAQVRQVKIELLKAATKSERQRIVVLGRFQHRQVRLPSKIPLSR